MILIAFENNLTPLPKQYPSEYIGDWKKDEIDSTHIISEETDKLLPSVKRRKGNMKKKQRLINMIKYKNLNQKSLLI